MVDQDDVLNTYNQEFNRIWRAICPLEAYISSPQQKNFNFLLDYPESFHPAMKRIYTAPGFVLGLPPIQKGIEAVQEMDAMGLTVFICTAPLPDYENCVLEKYRWVEKHLGRRFTERMILTRDKTFVQGDFLIDDNPEIKGATQPRWEQIIYDQPHNQHSKVAKRMFDWNDWKKLIGV